MSSIPLKGKTVDKTYDQNKMRNNISIGEG